MENAMVDETTTATTEDATGTTAEKTFTQAELDRIVKERLQREHAKAEQMAQKARAEAEAQALSEQGKYKELFEKQQADLQAAAERIKAMELNTLRRDIATKVGLPAAFVDRLRGETEADIEADAKGLLEALPRVAPNINSQSGGKAQPLTAADIAAKKRSSGHYVPM
jgi:Arc/MetJ family transcription regulator